MASLRIKNDLTQYKHPKPLLKPLFLFISCKTRLNLICLKKGIVSILLSFHLLLVFTGTRIFDFGRLPEWLQHPTIFYLSLTGGHPYSFFSPDIPAQYIVTTTLTDSSGHAYYRIMDRSTSTAGLRIMASIQLMCDNEDYETLAAIVAKYQRAQNPDTKKIVVTISKCLAPPPGTYGSSSDQELYKSEYRYD